MTSATDQSLEGRDGRARGTGEIYDRGYRHYEGQREGRGHAVLALIIYSIKRGLGIKKRWTAKIIPVILFAAAFFPVIIFVGIRAFLGEAAEGFDYVSLFEALSLILMVFAAATAPEMLCDDRRQNVLPLYFSRAINRCDYLLAKIAALGILMGTIALLPALILWLGNTFLAESPLSYFADNVDDVGRILVAGLLISIYLASIGLLISAFTDRKSIAAAIYIGAFLIVSGIASALFSAIESDWRKYIALGDPMASPRGIVHWVFDRTIEGEDMAAQANLDGYWYLLGIVVVTLVSGLVMHRRYLRDE